MDIDCVHNSIILPRLIIGEFGPRSDEQEEEYAEDVRSRYDLVAFSEICDSRNDKSSRVCERWEGDLVSLLVHFVGTRICFGDFEFGICVESKYANMQYRFFCLGDEIDFFNFLTFYMLL